MSDRLVVRVVVRLLHLLAVLRQQPAEPDALARRAAVLLQHARLERARLAHALRPHKVRALAGRLAEVRVGVRQAARQVADVRQSILRTHLRLHARRRPHRDLLVDERFHQVVEAHLRALHHTRRRQLPRVDARDERVIGSNLRRKAVVVIRRVVKHVARAARKDHAVGNRRRVVAHARLVLVRVHRVATRRREAHHRQLVGIYALAFVPLRQMPRMP